MGRATAVGTLTHWTTIASTVCMGALIISLNNDPFGWSRPFTAHPLGMGYAFVFALPAVIRLVIDRTNTPRDSTLHSYIAISLGVAAWIGFIGILLSKWQYDKPHFTSWHGQIGLAAMIVLFFVQVAGSKLFMPALMPISISRQTSLFIHRATGIVALVLLSVSMGLGFYSNWFLRNAGIVLYPAIIAATILFLSISRIVFYSGLFKRTLGLS